MFINATNEIWYFLRVDDYSKPLTSCHSQDEMEALVCDLSDSSFTNAVDGSFIRWLLQRQADRSSSALLAHQYQLKIERIVDGLAFLCGTWTRTGEPRHKPVHPLSLADIRSFKIALLPAANFEGKV